MKKRIVHVGLFGHVNAGKTSIARVLSQTVSTAGLDAHPQSKQRGITIDLGFTTFDIDEYKIALVDAPGHADLIRSAVASANIIDIALVVIDITKGFEVQTGEHMIVLEALGVTNIIFALNKIDLLPSDTAIEQKIMQIKGFLTNSGTTFKDAPIIPVSTTTKYGFDALIATLRSMIDILPQRRDIEGPFMMPFDHHFQVKGFGTVLTGTILSGTVKIGDTVEVCPLGFKGKVKSIHIFKEEQDRAEAGDRAGIAIPGIENEKLYRGCILATPGTIMQARHLIIEGTMISFFKHEMAFKSQVHLAAGMLTVPAVVFPFETRDDVNIAVETIATKSGIDTFHAYVHVLEPLPCKESMPILISRLDLPPQELRIAARGKIEKIIDSPPALFKLKEKIGRVKDGAKGVVEGLAESIEGASRMIGRQVVYIATEESETSMVYGSIIETFGTKGNVRVAFDGLAPATGTEIKMMYPKQLKYTVT